MINSDLTLADLLDMISDEQEPVHASIELEGPGEHRTFGGYLNVTRFVHDLQNLPKPWPRHRSGDEQYLALYYALENAVIHGNYPVKVEIFESSKGRVYCIADSGPGFDVEDTLSNERFNRLGVGFRVMKDCPATVSFNDKGNECYVLLRYK